MKTHSARWFQNSPTTWVLKETFKNGSAVLATIRDAVNGVHWLVEVGDERLIRASYHDAQRAARKVLREKQP